MKAASARLKQLHSILKPHLSEAFCGPSRSLSNSKSQVDILYSPKISLFDQKVHIKVQGLPTSVKVTLHCSVEQQWRQQPVKFVACGHYVSNQLGEVDVSRDESFGGTYTGIEPMGLFWSVEPCPAGPANICMVKRDVEQPVVYNLSVHLDHLSLHDLQMSQTPPRPVATVLLNRLVKDTNVKRFPVREGSIRGTLFLPPGEGPFPGVIEMSGLSGGLIESRAALLASHGFAALSLAFFQYQDLPASLRDVNFNYFEEAVNWLTLHPSVKEEGVGALAVSGSASYALLMGWLLPQVTSIVVINYAAVVVEDVYHGDQMVLRGQDMDLVHALKSTKGVLANIPWKISQEHVIPIWESQTHVLALLSDDDHQVPSKIGDSLYANYPEDKRHLIEVVHYPGAGHLLEPPYTPHSWSCYNPFSGMDLVWGGNKKDHAKAQDDAWKRTLNFFRTHLN